MKRSPLLILAALAALLSNASGVEILEDTFEQTYTLDPDATIRIKNIEGSIRFYAADVSDIHLTAVKKAYTAERLNGINIDVKATRKTLTIDTQFPPQKSQWSFADRSGTVEYTLVVPLAAHISECDLVNGEVLIEGLQGGAARAHLVNGWLAGHNCFADLDLSAVNGKLEVAYDWWQPEKSFSANATSVNGNVRALLPPDASVAVAAETEHGHVANNLEDGETDAGGDTRSIDVALGSGGGAEMTLRAKNGNVHIDRSY
jgi:hypothetical protein